MEDDLIELEEKKCMGRGEKTILISILAVLFGIAIYGFTPMFNTGVSCTDVCLENGALTSESNDNFCTCIFEDRQETMKLSEWQCKNQSIEEQTEICQACQVSAVTQVINTIRKNGFIEFDTGNEVVKLGEVK
jgi:hypothetical protein